MGEKLPPRELELYKRCDEVLHYLWDPIGVAGAPAARDEYHAYLPEVFAHVRDDRDPDALVAYLLDRPGAARVARMDLAARRLSWKGGRRPVEARATS